MTKTEMKLLREFLHDNLDLVISAYFLEHNPTAFEDLMIQLMLPNVKSIGTEVEIGMDIFVNSLKLKEEKTKIIVKEVDDLYEIYESEPIRRVKSMTTTCA